LDYYIFASVTPGGNGLFDSFLFFKFTKQRAV
jgi:hypothetical protein